MDLLVAETETIMKRCKTVPQIPCNKANATSDLFQHRFLVPVLYKKGLVYMMKICINDV